MSLLWDPYDTLDMDIYKKKLLDKILRYRLPRYFLSKILFIFEPAYIRFLHSYAAHSKKPVIVIGHALYRGRLGNKLQEFSRIIHYAREYGYTVMNVSFFRYAGFFQGTNKDLFCRYPLTRTFIGRIRPLEFFVYFLTRDIIAKIGRWLSDDSITCIVRNGSEGYPDLYSDEFRELIKDKKIVFLWGEDFIHKTLLTRHSNEIREYFKPLNKYSKNIKAPVCNLKKSSDLVVGVHIRRGDYRDHMGGRFFYDSCIYKNIMLKIQRLFPGKRVGYMISSDQEQNPAHFLGLNYVFASGEPVESMYSLALCDYIIGPPSSFSRWASFYGEVPLYNIEDTEADISLNDFKINYVI